MKITAPWTPEQVQALNRWQCSNYVHPFTCGGERGDADHRRFADEYNTDLGQLIAGPDGWVCPVCGYRQDWAHDFMLEPPEAGLVLSAIWAPEELEP